MFLVWGNWIDLNKISIEFIDLLLAKVTEFFDYSRLSQSIFFMDKPFVLSTIILSAIFDPKTDQSRSTEPEMTNENHEIVVLEIDAQTLHQWLQDRSLTLVDVRDRPEFESAHLPDALLRPLDRLDPHEIAQLPGPIVLYCRSGRRSALAGQRILSHYPIELVHLQGGILAWKAAGYSTVISDDTDSIKTQSTAPKTAS